MADDKKKDAAKKAKQLKKTATKHSDDKAINKSKKGSKKNPMGGLGKLIGLGDD